jgi:hypothetical protein
MVPAGREKAARASTWPGLPGAGLVAILIAGCGGAGASGSHMSAAQRVCGQAGRAAARVLGHSPTVRIANRDRADIVCRLHSGRVSIRVEAQASSQPWMEYGTTQVHLIQAFGSGSVHTRSQLPVNVKGVGLQALWVPAQDELVTTNATESSAGNYLTVQLSHVGPGGLSARRLASEVGRAALRAAPSGPKPGAPPA